MKQLFSSIFLLSIFYVQGQNPYNASIYKAFIRSDIPAWERTLDSMKQVYRQQPSDLMLKKIMRAQYGLAGYKIGVDEEDEGAAYLEAAWQNSGLLLNAHPEWADVIAIRSGLTGYKIAMAPYKAPVLGFESIKYVKDALKQDSTCAVAWMEKGHIAFFSSFMGYGYGKASAHYKKAVHYFEKKDLTEANWLYMNSLVHWGKALKKSGNLQDALVLYKRILSEEPGFKWVRDELLPGLKQAMENDKS